MRLSRNYLLGMLILVALGYAVPAYAPPKCDGPNRPPSCDKNGGGSGDTSVDIIGVHEHSDEASQNAPLWHPTDIPDPVSGEFNCVMTKNSGNGLSGAFPRHAECAHLATTGDRLEDDLIVVVQAHRGVVESVQVQGQDVIGLDSFVYISEERTPASVDTNADGNMVIHVHADDVMIYKCDTHVLKPKSNCATASGTFSIHDLVYSTAP